jgi:endonuclease G
MKYVSFFILLFLTTLCKAQNYLPNCSNDTIIKYNNFIVGYSESLKQPLWTAYVYVHKQSKYKRSQCHFREDKRYECLNPDDYTNTGFDRGHMCPAEDFSWDSISLCQTFYMTNIAPQHPQFNRIAWKELEHRIREWGKTDTLIVITGSYYSKHIVVNGMVVPTHFYKIVYSYNRKCAIAFIFPNRKVEGLKNYIVSIDYIESITGIDFFYKLKNQNFEKYVGKCFKID